MRLFTRLGEGLEIQVKGLEVVKYYVYAIIIQNMFDKKQGPTPTLDSYMQLIGSDRLTTPRRLWRKLGAGVMILGVLSSGAGGKVYGNDWLLGPKVLIEEIENNPAPGVSAQDRPRVLRLLGQPQNPELSRIKQQSKDMVKHPERAARLAKELHQFYAKQAEKYGLHLANTPRYKERVEHAGSVQEALEITNELTNQYGFSVSIPTSTGIKELGLGIKTVDPESRDLININQSLKDVIDGLALIPVELANKLSIDSIDLVSSIGLSAIGHDAVGYSNTYTHKIYLSIGSNFTNTVEHELGHFVDLRTSGLSGMHNDPSFSALNPDGFKYGQSEVKAVNKDWRPHNFNEPGEAVVDPFGASNISEDKATYYNQIFSSWAPGVRGPIVKEKFAELVARIDKLVPGYAKFYASISFRK